MQLYVLNRAFIAFFTLLTLYETYVDIQCEKYKKIKMHKFAPN